MSELLMLEDCVFERFCDDGIYSLVLWIKIKDKYVGRNIFYWTLVNILNQIKFALRSKRVQVYYPCPNDNYWNFDVIHFNGKCRLCKQYFHLQHYEFQQLIDFVNLSQHRYHYTCQTSHPSFVNRYYYMADVEIIPRTFLFMNQYNHTLKCFLFSGSLVLKQLTSKMEEMDTTISEGILDQMKDNVEEHISKHFLPFKSEVEEVYSKVLSFVGMRWTKIGPDDCGCIMTVLDSNRVGEARKEILEVFNTPNTNIKGIGFCNNNIFLFPTV